MNDINCKHSTGIVPYMYGELATSAATEFESHLLECQMCTDEFAALSSARYEVYDWKKLEFDPLATPTFEIPDVEVAGASWIDKLRAAFSGWAMPAAAFGGLAIIVALVAVFAVSRYETNTTTVAKRDTNVPANENTNRKKVEPVPSVTTVPDTAVKSDVIVPERNAPRPVPVKDTTPHRSVRGQQAVAPAKVRATPTTPNVPRLNDFAEEEDSSLRLAELFEDIDTRD
ncbi:MAG TPA: hypothetical protein VJV05_07110 [Pyrinomonadaceae bacterium]|nr:hypothetical protein [Pyrinomonadaceae bacterium]